MHKFFPIIVIAFALVGVAEVPPAFCQVYIHTNRFTPVADATILQNTPNSNYGSSNSLSVGLSSDGSSLGRALVGFDLSAIPTNAVVTNATLSFFQLNPISLENFYFVGVVQSNWVETGVTWNSRSPSLPWSTPGGDITSPIAELDIFPGGGMTNVFVDDSPDSGQLLQAVQTFVSNPAQNFGWMLMDFNENSPDGDVQFASREYAGHQPMLTVSYTLPFPSILLTILPSPPDTLRFVFDVEPFVTYTIQTTGNLDDTNWSNYGLPLDPTSIPTYHIQDVPLTASNAFFRVMAHPF